MAIEIENMINISKTNTISQFLEWKYTKSFTISNSVHEVFEQIQMPIIAHKKCSQIWCKGKEHSLD